MNLKFDPTNNNEAEHKEGGFITAVLIMLFFAGIASSIYEVVLEVLK